MKTKQLVKKIAAISTGIAMLGATLTGALALDTTLADYPAPFIKNGVFSGLLVVGANAAASDTIGQAILLADLQTKAVSPVTETKRIILGENSEEIAIGDSVNKEFDTELKDDDLKTLQDTKINFRSSSYDVEEVVVLGDSLKIQTSLTNGAKYESDVVMELGDKDDIVYKYVFNDEIDLDVDTQHPLEIKFLGKTLKIVDIDSDTKFTAYVGTEYFMNVGDSVSVEDKEVTLENVYEGNKASVSVNGVTKGISLGESEIINGIEVILDETFYETNTDQRSATIIVGEESKESFKNGDEYLDEWEWVIDDLKTENPILAITNDFDLEDDDALREKDCLELPNNYVSICFEGINTADESQEYIVDIDDEMLHIKTKENEGLKVGTEKTEEVWVEPSNNNFTKVYYDLDKDPDEYNHTDVGNVKIAETNYDDTELDFKLNYDGNKLTLTLEDIDDDLISTWSVVSNDVDSLSTLKYGTESIIDEDDNLRTRYGIIINDPESNADDNKIELSVPPEQVKGIVSLSGFGEVKDENVTTTVKTGGVKVNKIPTSVPVLDTEISDITSNNVILVGGPAVNKWVEPVFGLSVADFTPNEAFIRLVDNGDYVALLVAGYEAVDTRNAADAVARGKLAGKEKIDVVIKTESLGSYVVE